MTKMKQIKIILIISTFIISTANVFGQEELTPLISGTAKFSVKNGTIDCDLILSDYPHISNYSIRLNSGLNILNFQSLEPNDFILGFERDLTDSLQTDETNSYYFPANKQGEKFLPKKLRIRYVGKFPVIKDTISNNFQKGDWRGNIAFSENTMRADGYQSAWYPTLYDIEKDYQLENVRYNINIECEDCNDLYINGSFPVEGKSANFKSNIAREPLLFVGNYKIQKTNSLILLNTNFTNEELEKFETTNKSVIDFLNNYTKIPNEEKLVWIESNRVAKKSGFAFVSYPTITNVGFPPHDLKKGFENLYKTLLHTISHELSHYYFGNLKNFNHKTENILNEGFAEFLSLKYLNSIGQEKNVQNLTNEMLKYVNKENFKFKPIGEFQEESDTNDRETYAYDYQTLILMSIEKEIGEKKMQKWIQLLLNENKPISDFDFFKNTLKKATSNEKTYNEIINNLLIGNNTVVNINSIFNYKK